MYNTRTLPSLRCFMSRGRTYSLFNRSLSSPNFGWVCHMDIRYHAYLIGYQKYRKFEPNSLKVTPYRLPAPMTDIRQSSAPNGPSMPRRRFSALAFTKSSKNGRDVSSCTLLPCPVAPPWTSGRSGRSHPFSLCSRCSRYLTDGLCPSLSRLTQCNIFGRYRSVLVISLDRPEVYKRKKLNVVNRNRCLQIFVVEPWSGT